MDVTDVIALASVGGCAWLLADDDTSVGAAFLPSPILKSRQSRHPTAQASSEPPQCSQCSARRFRRASKNRREKPKKGMDRMDLATAVLLSQEREQREQREDAFGGLCLLCPLVPLVPRAVRQKGTRLRTLVTVLVASSAQMRHIQRC